MSKGNVTDRRLVVLRKKLAEWQAKFDAADRAAAELPPNATKGQRGECARQLDKATRTLTRFQRELELLLAERALDYATTPVARTKAIARRDELRERRYAELSLKDKP